MVLLFQFQLVQFTVCFTLSVEFWNLLPILLRCHLDPEHFVISYSIY